jgi:N-acyl-D-aspartate/D-glutamate deacylase
MTSFAAEAAGLEGRGVVKPGFAADLVLFDPQTVRANATFETPNRYSEGFRYVAVNGPRHRRRQADREKARCRCAGRDIRRRSKV